MFDNPLLIVTLIVGFYMAWNIGANDVANAFGCSVGSGALTLRRALILAAIFEFCGAFFAGANVADTIKGQIVLPEAFAMDPRNFAIGMLAALLAASIWVNVATFLAQPVSTTHAIIGAVIGFGIVSVGHHCIRWVRMVPVVSSWFVSPLCGAFLAFAIYLSIRKFVLAGDQPAARAKLAVPICLTATTLILSTTIFRTTLTILFPRLDDFATLTYALGAGLAFSAGIGARVAAILRRYPLHDVPADDQYRVIERWFGRLQIVTACYMSFAHGANDVANAIGPVIGIVDAARGIVSSKAAIPPWILAFGGFGIVVGLSTYGFKVIESVGKKITEVTPTRGFSAEFGTATTVLVCSLMGLPISTTFVLVGAVMGVGFARGFAAVDMGVVRQIFMSWLVTIPVSALLSAGLYWILKLFLA